MKFYLTSVANCLDQIESFRKLINSKTNLVILPISYHDDYINCSEDIINHFDRSPLNRESIYWHTVQPFINAGMNPDRVTIINPYRDPIEYVRHRLTQSNTIVYLPGGYPENIVKNMYRFGYYPIIKYCSVLVGESAGSMAPFADFFVYPDHDYKTYKRFKGLHLISKMTVIPHFERDDDRMVSACAKFQQYSSRTKIYCIEDGGYIVLENNKVTEKYKANVYRNRKKHNEKVKKVTEEAKKTLKSVR